ncbi:hypothetical protein E2562_038949 [Oryza meyeriana var. granulata]|uniref:GCF C-terminal domain-containing protein n=1 Tax=Oryza meyeriana var. granulata TaxID=110450 RepID=A0A6G1C4D0_9ORYZ|nr:hypothetical protein E2562_038949 [Oryza meyeriana var. granulata]
MREEGTAYAAARAQPQKMLRGSARMARLSSHDGDGSRLVWAEEEITRAMAVVRRETSSGTLTLGGLICEFEQLKEKFPEAYGTYRLAYTAGRLAAPRLHPLRPKHGRWDLLQRPAGAPALVQSLRNILEEDAPESAMSAYTLLINDVVLPSVRASPWNVTNPEQMLRFVETWKDNLPPSAMRFILQEVVMPELVAAAESWSPVWWTEPGSVWVSPSIPHLGLGRLHGVYVAITTELRRWMKGRDVTQCAYSEVSQWKDVFDPATWDEFVQRQVLPVVSRSLQDLSISPAMTWGRGNTFPLVMRWALLVPARYMVPVLESKFFAKWRYAVYRFVTEVRPLPREAAVWGMNRGRGSSRRSCSPTSACSSSSRLALT